MFSLILTCLLSPAAVPTSGPELTIVHDGKTNWVIVLLPAPRSLVRHGAAGAAKTHRADLGRRLPIVDASASAVPPERSCSASTRRSGPEAFRIRTMPERYRDQRRRPPRTALRLLQLARRRLRLPLVHREDQQDSQEADPPRRPADIRGEAGVRVSRAILLRGVRPRLGRAQSSQRQLRNTSMTPSAARSCTGRSSTPSMPLVPPDTVLRQAPRILQRWSAASGSRVTISSA